MQETTDKSFCSNLLPGLDYKLAILGGLWHMIYSKPP